MKAKKKLPTLPEQFKHASDHGDVSDLVRLAAPIAQRSLYNDGLNLEEYLLDDVAMLAGSNERFNQHHNLVIDQDHWFAFCEHVWAAFALGIAFGQMANPAMLSTKPHTWTCDSPKVTKGRAKGEVSAPGVKPTLKGLKELADELRFSSEDACRAWLRRQGIVSVRRGRIILVDGLDVDAALRKVGA